MDTKDDLNPSVKLLPLEKEKNVLQHENEYFYMPSIKLEDVSSLEQTSEDTAEIVTVKLEPDLSCVKEDYQDGDCAFIKEELDHETMRHLANPKKFIARKNLYNSIEKLIELVRKYKCLYDLKDKYYRNKVYKMRQWAKIAQEMNMTNDAVKHKWKALRDAYVKYKKQLAGQTESGRKNLTYVWSDQLSFLDDTIQPRSSVDDPQNNEILQSNYSGSETTVIDQALHSDNVNDIENPTTSSDTPSTLTLVSPQELEIPNPPALSPTPGFQAQTRTCRKTESDVDKALKYLQSKNRPVHDGIDLLFLSYASTLKTFSHRKQTELKVKLAKIFAEAELSEIEKTSVPSPAHSFGLQASSRTLPPQELTSYRNDLQNLQFTNS